MTYVYIADTGVIVADTSSIKEDVQEEYKKALGQDLVLGDATPQGRLIDAETTARANAINGNAQVANQINPNLATGLFLGSIAALMGISAGKDTYSVLKNVSLGGLPFSVIPSGSTAKTADGTALFKSTSTVVLNASGAGTSDFVCTVPGPVQVAVGTLTVIVDQSSGWSTVSNPTAAILGTSKLSDAQLRLYRKDMLAKQGVGSIGAIYASVISLPGVKSVGIRQNVESATAVVDGLSMPANSLWVCVDGGIDLSIATALLGSKSGCAWTWADHPVAGKRVSVSVIEPSSGQAYVVKFSRPDEVKVAAHVQVKSASALQQPQQAVVTAVMDYVNGLIPGERGLTIGTSVSPFELSGAVTARNPGMYVKWCGVWIPPAVDPGPPNAAELPMAVWQKATLAPADVRVTVLP